MKHRQENSMSKLKRLQKKSNRLYLKLRKIEMQIDYIDDCIKMIEPQEQPKWNEMTKHKLNSLYGKMVTYSDTDSVKMKLSIQNRSTRYDSRNTQSNRQNVIHLKQTTE